MEDFFLQKYHKLVALNKTEAATPEDKELFRCVFHNVTYDIAAWSVTENVRFYIYVRVAAVCVFV